MMPLLGIVVLALGFAARLNPLIVVLVAALTSGLADGIPPLKIIAALGKAFNDSRSVSIVWLVLPVIGLLEREGLQERARMLVARLGAVATTGRLLLAYLALRQITAALGLLSLGGHAQMVRPLVAPMAEGAAEARFDGLSMRARHLIRAYAASADNVGAFFGEDIFVAMGSVLLIRAALEQSGFRLAPLQLSVWAVPTALVAFAVHGVRLWRLDARLRRMADEERR
jgi:uncharacterized membrane protein